MTLKRLLPLLRGLFGLDPVSDPVQQEYPKTTLALTDQVVDGDTKSQSQNAESQRLGKINNSKKVLFLSRHGKKLTARYGGLNRNDEIILQRAGHPLAPVFVRPTTEVFTR